MWVMPSHPLCTIGSFDGSLHTEALPKSNPTPARLAVFKRALTYYEAAWSTRFSGHLKSRRHIIRNRWGQHGQVYTEFFSRTQESQQQCL